MVKLTLIIFEVCQDGQAMLLHHDLQQSRQLPYRLKLNELQLNLCEICDFVSNWKTGLSIHLSRKHGNIEQLDGHNDSSFSDEKYDSSRHYWETGRLGKRYQTYLDASEIIDKSDISEDDKLIEKEKLSNARKSVFCVQDKQNFKYFPPWNCMKWSKTSSSG